MTIRTIVLDFDQTLASAHVYHSLPNMCMNENEKERVQAIFSFFEKKGWDVYVASGNYKDVVVKWLEEAGVCVPVSNIWCDRDGYFSEKKCVFEVTIAYMDGTSSTGTKGDCMEYLTRITEPSEIVYIDDTHEEVECVRLAYPTVRAIHKPHYISLTTHYLSKLIS